ncbi:MAG: ABC transporter ATP-binding protein [Acidobacteriota bacterium]|nr:MAG: ABC transporter ATP-binding protein [Acidobacteriota bacterium]
MIEVEGVTKVYGPFTAVSNLSFSVEAGEILGFLGPNGAGKTTTMRVLTGFFPPSAGSARVAGHDVVAEPLAAKAKIGYLPETPPLYPEMSVVDYVHFVAHIKGVPSGERAEKVDRALERCSLTEVRDKLTAKLSKGFRQRVGLAQALVHDPEVLILDEPTAGLDPQQIGETRELIKTLGGNHTIILSTHILPEVSMTCDRVVIINRGRLVAQGTPESLTSQFRDQVRDELRKTASIDVTIQGSIGAIEDVIRETDGVVDFHETGREPNDVISLAIEVSSDADVRRTLAERIVTRGLGLLELHHSGMSLEDVYLRAIANDAEDTR